MHSAEHDRGRDHGAGESGTGHGMLVQQLFVKHSPQLRAYAVALAGDFAAADDVVQETFLTVTAKAADFQSGTNFLRIARSMALPQQSSGR
jgi:RNA polymerase sigma-70 factor (ECF subfamily)